MNENLARSTFNKTIRESNIHIILGISNFDRVGEIFIFFRIVAMAYTSMNFLGQS